MLLVLLALQRGFGVRGGVHPLLKQRSPDTARRDAVHADVVAALVDRQRARHRVDGALRRAVGARILLTHATNQTAHVDDTALRLAEIGKTELGHEEVREHIQLEQVHHILSREVVNRPRRGVVPSVVDQTVDLSVLLYSEVHERLQVLFLADVARLERGLANLEIVHLLLLGMRIPTTPVTKLSPSFGFLQQKTTFEPFRTNVSTVHEHRTNKPTNSGANTLGSTGDDYYLIQETKSHEKLRMRIVCSLPLLVHDADWRNEI